MKKVTIKDIAREAGVSIATVSNVMNNKSNKVSEKKKREIRELMDKYNYAPNLNARSLVAQESKMIGILYYSTKDEIDFGDPFISDLMTGLEFEAKKLGMFLMFHGFNGLKDIDVLQRNWNFDGFIVVGAFEHIITELINKISKPMIFIDSYYNISVPRSNIVFVNNDDRKLSYTATKLLLDHGHRQIAFFSPNFRWMMMALFLNATLDIDALMEYGLKPDEKLLFREDNLENFVSEKQSYTASVINSDYLAAQYIHKLRDHKLEFRSLVSFDNNIFAKLLDPALSTVDLRQKEKGKISLSKINTMLQNPDQAVERHFLVEGELINRKSVLEREE